MSKVQGHGGPFVRLLERDEPQASTGPQLHAPPRARVVPRLFQQASAGLRNLLRGRGEHPAPPRRDQVLDKALASLLRELAKSTRDNIVKNIPAKLRKLDKAVRRHGDADSARERIQDGARDFMRNADRQTLQALRRFDGGNAGFYHMRNRIDDGARLGRERELGNLIAEQALMRSCELALADALIHETPASAATALAAVLDEIPLRRLVPAGDVERISLWDNAPGDVQRRVREQNAGGIEKNLGLSSSQDTPLRRLAGELSARLDAAGRARVDSLARQMQAETGSGDQTRPMDARERQGRLLLALLADVPPRAE